MLSLSNLTISCDNKEIVKNITLTLQPGTINVLMGPNGSGKSTLAYTLMGHPRYSITSGLIRLDNSDVQELSVEKRARAGIFLASQYVQEIPGVQVFTFLKEAHRVLTGLEIPLAEFKGLVYKALDLVNLDHSFAYRNLYENFSGGEKKRLDIVQLLLFKPKVAILDEIDSGLDIDALKIIAQAIQEARKDNPQLSILLITHYARILKYLEPNYVHVLKEGSLAVSSDKHLAELVEQKGYDGLLL